jgi:hypothetical protein
MKPWNWVLFFIICSQLAAYVIANVVVMPSNVEYDYGAYAQHGSDIIGKYNIENTASDFDITGDTDVTKITDYASSGINIAAALTFVLNAIASFLVAYPMLTNTYHLDPFWATLFQVVIYIVYAVSFFSWLSGKHPDATL